MENRYDTIKKMNSRRSRSGQTLLEAMIALFILTIGLLGMLSLLAQSLFLSKNIGNQTIATYLAAEGIELARSRIDHDMYEALAGGSGWSKGGLDPTFPQNGDYQLDYTTCENIAFPNPCDQQAPPYDSSQHLLFDPSTNLYSYAGSAGTVVTPFTRDIKVLMTSNAEIDVQSIVSWSTGSPVSQSIILEDHFYNWHP